MMPGETLQTGAPGTCPECAVTVELQVCSSAAGYWVGTMCDCGPYSRESGYYRRFEDADEALSSGTWSRS